LLFILGCQYQSSSDQKGSPDKGEENNQTKIAVYDKINDTLRLRKLEKDKLFQRYRSQNENPRFYSGKIYRKINELGNFKKLGGASAGRFLQVSHVMNLEDSSNCLLYEQEIEVIEDSLTYFKIFDTVQFRKLKKHELITYFDACYRNRKGYIGVFESKEGYYGANGPARIAFDVSSDSGLIYRVNPEGIECVVGHSP
jgi:hypothetical protein